MAHQVEIRRNSVTSGLEDADEEDENDVTQDYEDSEDGGETTSENSPVDEPPGTSLFITKRCNSIYQDMDGSPKPKFQLHIKDTGAAPNWSRSSPILKNIRRLSVTLSSKPRRASYDDTYRTGRRFSKMFGDEEDYDYDVNDVLGSMPRYGSVHGSTQSLACLPHDRRVEMTHKLEGAMAILDDLQGKKDNSVDTEKSNPLKFSSVSAFNEWASEWNKEFKFKP